VAFTGQLAKLKNIASEGEDWAGVKIIVTPSAGGEQQTTMLPAESVPMWLTTINLNKVSDELRPKLLQYKNEAAKVLAAHFMPTVAPQPQMDQISSLQILSHIVQALQDQDKKVTDVQKRLAEVESAPPKRIRTNTLMLKTLRETFHLDLRTFTANKDFTVDDLKALNSELKRATGRQRATWDLAHFRAAVDHMQEKFGFNASKTRTELARIDATIA
jgi:hypothetical protein